MSKSPDLGLGLDDVRPRGVSHDADRVRLLNQSTKNRGHRRLDF